MPGDVAARREFPRHRPPMLRIFDRYLGRQIMVSTFFAVSVLSVVLVLGQIFKKLLDKLVEGVLPPSAILKFIGYTFPWSLSYTVPWGILTAVLLTFGRLSADNELISMRMAGMSLRRICAPVFAVSILASGLCFWINTTVAPHAYTEVRRTTQEAVLRDPQAVFKADKIVDDITGFIFYTESKKEAELKNLQIFALQPDRANERAKPTRFIFAKEAAVLEGNAMKSKVIEMDLKNVNFVERDWPYEAGAEERKAMTPEQKAEYEARTREASAGPPPLRTPQSEETMLSMSLARMIDKSAKLRVDGMSMSQLRTGMRDRAILEQDGLSPPSDSEMRTEFHRRLSFSMACFILALVGIPFGITAQRRETSVGFVLSLVVGITYFALIMLGGLWQDRPDKMPHLWVWMPNVIFGSLGVFMFLRLQRR